MKKESFFRVTMAALLSASVFVACNDDDNGSDTPENTLTDDRAVSLGLSSGTKWANVNIGATNPWENGDYFAWGETTAKETYCWSTYLHRAAGQTEEGEEWKLINKYQIVDGANGIWYSNVKFVGDNKTTLEPEDDAATVNWGGDWVTPSRVDFIELRNFCEVERTDDYKGSGVAGVIYKANGKEAFFPNAGMKFMDLVMQERNVGPLWANSIIDTDWAFRVWAMDRQEINEFVDGYDRFMGFGVRPVCNANGNTNGHEAVDFGLPSGKLWATMNVGAQKAEDYGYYLAWGETEPKETYCDSTYKYAVKGDPGFAYSYTKYQVEDSCIGGKWYSKDFVGDGKATIEDIDDAATVNWGGKWKMPTTKQIKELINECYWLWTDNYDGTHVSGYIVFKAKRYDDKGKKVYGINPQLKGYTLKDNHIFLPSTGLYVSNIKFDGYIYCWAATIEETDAAHILCVEPDYPSPRISQVFRMYGLPIRPVLNK